MDKNLETVIQTLHSLHEEMGALAWVALGIVLPISIIAGSIAVYWIRCGGLSAGSAQKFFAEQRQIDYLLRDR